MGETARPDNTSVGVKRKRNESSNQQSQDSSDLNTASNQSISLSELERILNKYTPQSWYRILARNTLGLFLESFRYSWPVWNLKELIKNPEQKTFTEDDIKQALRKPSMFDLKLAQRETEIDNKNQNHQESKNANLNTDEVIKEVLQHLRKK